VFQLRIAAALLFAPIVVGAQQPHVRAITPTASLAVSYFRETTDAFTQYSGIRDSLRLVIRDSATWHGYWAAIQRPFIPAPAAPGVDFSREMIVLAAAGTRPTGGFGIRIETVTADSARVVVVVRRTIPGSSCAVAAAVTQPVDLARIPVTPLPVTFAERVEQTDCAPQALHRD
jgi:hypothetical protein